MTLHAAFAPRDCFETPEDFGREPNMKWIPGRNLDEAVRVARAIDQHVLAMEVNRFLRRGHYSVADLAKALMERPETLSAKLRGRAPATERDLILWSWLTGGNRAHPPIERMGRGPDGESGKIFLPGLGTPARVAAQRLRFGSDLVE